MVDPFGGLDAVEEFLVAHGVGEVGERRGDAQGAGRVAPGHARGPGLDPGPGGRGALGRREEVTRPQPVEHRVAEVGVGPVHDRRRPAVTAPVAGVEVAVHEGVGQAALVQPGEPAQQVARGGRLPGAELAGDRAVEQGTDLPGDDRRAPVEQSGKARSEWIGKAAGQGGLGRDQAPDGAGDDLRGGVPAVLTGQVLEQDPSGPGTDDGRDEGRVHVGERGDDAGLVGGEAGRGLQPDRGGAGRQLEQRGQVPRLTLHGGPGHVAARRGEDVRGPAEQFEDAVQPGPRRAPFVRHVQLGADIGGNRRAAGQQAGGRAAERGHVVRHVPVPGAVAAVDAQQAQHDHGYAEHLAQAGRDRLRLRPPRDVDAERTDGAEKVVVTGHQRADGSPHPASVNEPGGAGEADIGGAARPGPPSLGRLARRSLGR